MVSPKLSSSIRFVSGLKSLLALPLLVAWLLTATAAENILYLYNWNNYISDETVRRFEATCQCRLKQDYYSDNEEMLAKLGAGAVGYDLIVPTGNAVESLIRQKALRKLDKQQLRRLGNLKPEYLDTWFDPANQYSVPYAYTVTLIGYNEEKLREHALPNDTWALIFEPRYLEKLKGHVSVLNSARELMAAAMIYLGYSIHDTDPKKWAEAKGLILRAKPYWATFSNNTYIKDLAIGNLWVVHGYSNDMFRSQADAQAAARTFHIGFSIPREGAVIALDSFVIHKSSAHPELAHAFINFMLDGRNAADVSNLIGAGNPNAVAMQLIRRELVDNPAIFPSPDETRKLQMLRDFDVDSRRRLSRLWTEIKVR